MGPSLSLRMLVLLAAMAPPIPDNRPSFLASDVKRGRDPVPKGKVKIHALRNGVIKVTEAVNAADVDWSKLADDDRIEVLDA